ncbi:FadR/GntR family transcriptional regulator [Kineococcus aurantiacus]|uniref:FadR/GntR family transcriptional regulator n=1 Tax=Kineococcus aurantiacus TaxID=37633 RepID=UPI0031D65A19
MSTWAERTPTVTRVGAAEAVFADLRDAILGGELPVGTRLPSEAALSERHGVSRSVVREALRSCHALGLTEPRTGLGSFVVRDRVEKDPVFGTFAASELLEARPLVEVPAAGWAAVRHTDSELAELRGLIEAMTGEPDPQEWAALDGRLHGLVAQASRNRVLESVLAAVREASTAQSQALNLLPDRRHRSDVEHAAIVEAIATRDYDAAADAMRAHLTAVGEALRALVERP